MRLTKNQLKKRGFRFDPPEDQDTEKPIPVTTTISDNGGILTTIVPQETDEDTEDY